MHTHIHAVMVATRWGVGAKRKTQHRESSKHSGALSPDYVCLPFLRSLATFFAIPAAEQRRQQRRRRFSRAFVQSA